ncbi:ATP-binding response regulator [Chromobacterium haemolyticum]|uniref:ATP-binding response regulator n=1 Tax=Chromobacterium haemolyticum TaxID=394935 RepID=UPI00244BD607|nr:ATP-binding protein [Chromobacterium haemolyticum]MDH0342137.1 ATP-binding protein [Chromobacterium haemolyticum]
MLTFLRKGEWRQWLLFAIVAILLPVFGFLYAQQTLFSKQALEQAAGPGEGYYWAASQYRYAVQRIYAETYAYSLGEESFDDLQLAHDVLQSKYLILNNSVALQLRQIPEYAELLERIAIFMKKMDAEFPKIERDPARLKSLRNTIADMMIVVADLANAAHDVEVRKRDLSIDQTLHLRNFAFFSLFVLWAAIVVFLARELIRARSRQETIELQQKAIEAVKVAHEEAVETALARSTMLSTVSHEILTPLHTVQGGVELLAETVKDARTLRTIGNIRTAADYLSRLMQDLLDMGRLDAGRMTLRPTVFDPRQLVSTVVSDFQPAAKAKGIVLRFEVAAVVSSKVYADSTRVRQVISNLISNAVRYSDQGEIRVALDQEYTNPALLIVTVADTGVGIPANEQASLFEPFTQASGASRGGAGMGLAIVRRLTTLMGGSITLAHSEVGKGSTFIAKMPADIVDDGSGDREGGSPQENGGLKLLIVEDDDSLRGMLVEMLDHYGFSCDTSRTGESAMAKLKETSYDAVVLDIKLPDQNGLELLNRLRAENSTNRAVPVIGITANKANFTDERSRLLTAKLEKPFGNRALLDNLMHLHV